jgi:hypothetical protein
MIQRLPEPAGLFFAAHETPPLIEFGFFHLVNNDRGIGRTDRL